MVLADLASKCKKKGLINDKRKKGRSGIMVKCKGPTKRRKNDYEVNDAASLVELDNSFED